MAPHLTRSVWKGFLKKHCTSNPMDGTDNMLWNDSEKNVNVRTECEEDERTDCEDGDRTKIGKGR
jgi:hypothetical protein